MADIHYTDSAVFDLDAIYAYFAIEQNYPEYAERLLRGIQNTTQTLSAFPMIGSPRFEWQANLRALMHERYVILYTYEEFEEVVLIQRILNGRQDIEGEFKSD